MRKGLYPANRSNQYCCYIAGNFFPTARALIGYFEVTWHLTMKLFPANISERGTLQKSMTSEGNSARFALGNIAILGKQN